MLQEVTTLTEDGKFKSLEDIQEIMKNVDDIKDATLRSQMNNLLAAAAKGAGALDIEQKKQNKEVKYKKELQKLTAQTDRQINLIETSASLPKKLPDGSVNPDYRSITDAKLALKQLETRF